MTSAMVMSFAGRASLDPPSGAPLGRHDPGPPEIGEDVVEEVPRDLLAACDLVGLHELVAGRRQLGDRSHGVVGLRGDPHGRIPVLFIDSVVFVMNGSGLCTSTSGSRLRD